MHTSWTRLFPASIRHLHLVDLVMSRCSMMTIQDHLFDCNLCSTHPPIRIHDEGVHIHASMVVPPTTDNSLDTTNALIDIPLLASSKSPGIPGLATKLPQGPHGSRPPRTGVQFHHVRSGRKGLVRRSRGRAARR